MRRGSTPTFTFSLPIDSSRFTDITASMVQNGKNILSLPSSRISKDGKIISFKLTEKETFLFDEGSNAEIQLRAVENLGNILISDVKKIAITKKYPEDAQR